MMASPTRPSVVSIFPVETFLPRHKKKQPQKRNQIDRRVRALEAVPSIFLMMNTTKASRKLNRGQWF
jgi:hypothetical protein